MQLGVFSPDGKTLPVAVIDSIGKSLKLWDVRTGQLLKVFDCRASIVNSVSLSPDGRTLASGDELNMVQLWNVATGRFLKL